MKSTISEKDFEKLVNNALDNLPDENLKELDNVVIVVEDWPTPYQLERGEVTRGTLFGLYEGVPKTKRGIGYTLVTPDKITIFKGPLTRAAVNEDHLKHLVDNTVWHEVAHHFGLGHGRIHQLERKAQVKRQFSEKIEYETSDLLNDRDVNHAWFTRHGGVSQSPFESLNTAFPTRDRVEFVEENIRRALTELTLDRSRLVVAMVLAHSNKVLAATTKDAGKMFSGYDAIVTDVVDLPIALNTADCLPIFIYDQAKKVVGIIHAGWRGLEAGVIPATIKKIKSQYGSDPKDIVAAIGPGAGAKSYEVGKDLEKAFDSKYFHHKSQKIYLNINKLAIDQLNDSGVTKVEDKDIDTITNKKFFSYRRENITGRNFNVISL